MLNWGKPIATGTPQAISENAEVRRVYLGDSSATPRPAAPRPTGSADLAPVLEVKGLTAGYGDMVALRDVSLSLGKGEVVAVLGANGAGKSTLCSAIMGAVRLRSGSVTAFGEDISRAPVHERSRRGLAYCQEGRRIFGELTVEENLALGASLSLPQKDLAERMSSVHEIFPILAERSGQVAGTMSGGQQQMLAVGRALMADPQVLICDEISLGLAPVAIDALYEALRQVNRNGVAILLVEQNVHRSLELAHHAIVLSRGRVSYDGDPGWPPRRRRSGCRVLRGRRRPIESSSHTT